MKNISRPYLYLVGIIVVAALVWFVEKPTAEKQGDILNKPLFKELDTSQVERVEIEHLLNGVQLKKESGEWKVASLKTKIKENLEGANEEERPETRDSRLETKNQESGEKWYAADGSKVSLSLNVLVDINAISLAGTNPEKHGFFEVNPVGMQVRLFDGAGKKLAHLFIGKGGAAFVESYVRKDGENDVYLANRYLRSSFSPEADSWRDRKIWDTATGNVQGIQVERPKNPFALKKEEGKWKLTSPKAAEADDTKVSNLVSQLSKVTAAGFEEELKKEMGLDKPAMKLTLITDAGPYTLKFGKEKDKNTNQYYVQKEGDPQVYLVSAGVQKAIPEDWKELTLNPKSK